MRVREGVRVRQRYRPADVTVDGILVMDVFVDGSCELFWVDSPSPRTAVLETEMRRVLQAYLSMLARQQVVILIRKGQPKTKNRQREKSIVVAFPTTNIDASLPPAERQQGCPRTLGTLGFSDQGIERVKAAVGGNGEVQRLWMQDIEYRCEMLTQ